MAKHRGELMMPEFFRLGYGFLGEDYEWHIKDDAPDWAKQEFEEFFKKLNAGPDENGNMKQY